MRISDWSSDVCSSDLVYARIAPPGWRDARVDGAAWAPRFDGADQRLLRQFANDKGQVVTVAIGGYERQAEGREVVAFGQGAVDLDSKWAWSAALRSEEHTSELQSLMRISYAVFCLKKKKTTDYRNNPST